MFIPQYSSMQTRLKMRILSVHSDNAEWFHPTLQPIDPKKYGGGTAADKKGEVIL